jgi:hypothetical protein
MLIKKCVSNTGKDCLIEARKREEKKFASFSYILVKNVLLM